MPPAGPPRATPRATTPRPPAPLPRCAAARPAAPQPVVHQDEPADADHRAEAEGEVLDGAQAAVQLCFRHLRPHYSRDHGSPRKQETTKLTKARHSRKYGDPRNSRRRTIVTLH